MSKKMVLRGKIRQKMTINLIDMTNSYRKIEHIVIANSRKPNFVCVSYNYLLF